MTWLTPIAGAILAAAVISPLIILYFLRLRRRTQPIACTLLWKRAVEDLRANAPFQRLRRSLLLLLQLLALILLALSVAQPQLESGQPKSGKIVLLIDNSASMSADDGPEGATRLEEAKRQAKNKIEQMYAGGLFARSSAETMIIAFSDRAEVMCGFTSSKQQLLNAIDAINPTHGESRITEALKLARAYTTNVDPENPRAIGEPALLELYSDGEIEDLAEQVLRGETLTFHTIGSPEADNVAIGVVSVERPYDKPSHIQVFASLLNFNPEPVSCTLQLSVNGTVLLGGLEDVRIAGAEVDPAGGEIVPGRNNIVFEPFEQPRGVVIEVANLRKDNLAADNTAQLVIPAAKSLRVALVDATNFILPDALRGLALAGVDRFTGAEFEAAAAEGRLEQYDLIVLDDFAPASLPPGRYLSFGASPPIEGLNEFGVREELQLILDAREEHPLLRYVDLSDVVFADAHLIQPADDVTVLAEASSGAPAIIEASRGPVHIVHVTFDLAASNFPFDYSFPTFIYNAVDYLGHLGEAVSSTGIRPGEALTTRLPGSATDITIQTPDSPRGEPVILSDPSQFSWGPVRLAGLHVVSWSEPGTSDRQTRPFAVDLFSQTEGNIAPLTQLEIASDKIEGTRADDSAYTALWPWAVGLCLALLMIEWWVYHRKTFV